MNIHPADSKPKNDPVPRNQGKQGSENRHHPRKKQNVPIRTRSAPPDMTEQQKQLMKARNNRASQKRQQQLGVAKHPPQNSQRSQRGPRVAAPSSSQPQVPSGAQSAFVANRGLVGQPAPQKQSQRVQQAQLMKTAAQLQGVNASRAAQLHPGNANRAAHYNQRFGHHQLQHHPHQQHPHQHPQHQQHLSHQHPHQPQTHQSPSPGITPQQQRRHSGSPTIPQMHPSHPAHRNPAAFNLAATNQAQLAQVQQAQVQAQAQQQAQAQAQAAQAQSQSQQVQSHKQQVTIPVQSSPPLQVAQSQAQAAQVQAQQAAQARNQAGRFYPTRPNQQHQQPQFQQFINPQQVSGTNIRYVQQVPGQVVYPAIQTRPNVLYQQQQFYQNVQSPFVTSMPSQSIQSLPPQYGSNNGQVLVNKMSGNVFSNNTTTLVNAAQLKKTNVLANRVTANQGSLSNTSNSASASQAKKKLRASAPAFIPSTSNSSTSATKAAPSASTSTTSQASEAKSVSDMKSSSASPATSLQQAGISADPKLPTGLSLNTDSMTNMPATNSERSFGKTPTPTPTHGLTIKPAGTSLGASIKDLTTALSELSIPEKNRPSNDQLEEEKEKAKDEDENSPKNHAQKSSAEPSPVSLADDMRPKDKPKDTSKVSYTPKFNFSEPVLPPQRRFRRRSHGGSDSNGPNTNSESSSTNIKSGKSSSLAAHPPGGPPVRPKHESGLDDLRTPSTSTSPTSNGVKSQSSSPSLKSSPAENTDPSTPPVDPIPRYKPRNRFITPKTERKADGFQMALNPRSNVKDIASLLMYSLEEVMALKDKCTQILPDFVAPVLNLDRGSGGRYGGDRRGGLRGLRQLEGPPRGVQRTRNAGYHMGGRHQHHRRNGRSRGGRQGRHGQAPMPGVVVTPLAKSDNRWQVGLGENSELDSACKKILSLLNKLTLEKFDTISTQMIAMANEKIHIPGVLEKVVAKIFDKALGEAYFASMYSQLCVELMHNIKMEPTPDEEHDEQKQKRSSQSQFKRILLDKCQAEFERGLENVDISDKTEEEAKEIRTKQKQRFLGNIRFIGELYKHGMLKECVMHDCIRQQINTADPNAEDVESLCNLLSNIGKKIDHSKARKHIDVYFAKIKELSVNSALASRIRFMCLDLIDLRKNKWVPRQKKMEAKTISQIHKENQHLQRQINRQNNNPSARPKLGQGDIRGSFGSSRGGRGGGGRGGGGRSGPASRGDRYASLKLDSNSPSNNANKARKSSDVRSSGSNTGGRASNRGGRFGSWESSDRGRTSRAGNDRRDGNDGRWNRVGDRRSKDSGSRQSYNNYRSSQIPANPPSGPPAEKVTEVTDKLRNSIKNTMLEYLSAQDKTEVKLCIEEFNLASNAAIVEGTIRVILDKVGRPLDTLAGLLADMVESKVLVEQDFVQGIGSILDELEELMMDLPRAGSIIAEILAFWVCKDVCSPSFLKPRLGSLGDRKTVERFISAFLTTLVETNGSEWAQTKWSSANLNLKDFLLDTTDPADFLTRAKLPADFR